MRVLTSLEKKAELKLAKYLKSKTHFTLNEILILMEHYRSSAVLMTIFGDIYIQEFQIKDQFK